MESIDKIYDLLNSIKVTKNNQKYVNEIKGLLATENYMEALKKMRELKDREDKASEEGADIEIEGQNEENNDKYPKQLSNKRVGTNKLTNDIKLTLLNLICFKKP